MGEQVYSKESDHMTKVAAMPIYDMYDKNFKKSSSPEPKGS